MSGEPMGRPAWAQKILLVSDRRKRSDGFTEDACFLAERVHPTIVAASGSLS